MSFYTKSSDQGAFQRGDQAAYRRVRLRKHIFIRFLARISSDQGPSLSAIKRSRQIFVNQKS